MKRIQYLLSACALMVGVLVLSAAAPSSAEIDVGPTVARTSALDEGTAWVRCNVPAYYAVGNSSVGATASSTSISNVNVSTPVAVSSGQYIALRAATSGKCWVTLPVRALLRTASTARAYVTGSIVLDGGSNAVAFGGTPAGPFYEPPGCLMNATVGASTVARASSVTDAGFTAVGGSGSTFWLCEGKAQDVH